MEEERIEMSAVERERLKVLHLVEQRHLKQVEAAERLRLSARQVRRLLRRVAAEGDGGIVHRLRGRRSNRRFAERWRKRVMERVRQRYADFGPTLAAEHLAGDDHLRVSRETLRKWMAEAGLRHPRRRRPRAVHVWRERRAACGELAMMDSSVHAWLEERGPEKISLIALIDDATGRWWGRFVVRDTTEENLRTLGGWLKRHGRPVALYTDKHSIFCTTRPASVEEQRRGSPARTQFGRALDELGIAWIAAHSPQAKGRMERLFETLQDRLIKQMRLAGVDTLEGANHFLETRFLPDWEQRFVHPPRQKQDAHRRLECEHVLEEILSVRAPRVMAQDHTVSWEGQRWGVARVNVCAGLRGARVEIERRLDGTHWLRFRRRYLPLHPCPAAPPRPATPSGLRPPGVAKPKNKFKTKFIPPPHHPWRLPWKRTFLSGKKPDISTLR